MDIYELRRLDFLDLRDSIGVGAYRKISDRTGIDASYLSRCGYPPGKAGRKNISDKIVSVLDQAYPGWRKRELDKIASHITPHNSAKEPRTVDYDSTEVVMLTPDQHRDMHTNGAETPKTGTTVADRDSEEPLFQHRYLIRSVPVLSRNEVLTGKKQENTERQTIDSARVSASAFAMSIFDIINPTDRYNIQPGSFIIIDPDAEWEHGKPLLIIDNNSNLKLCRYEVIGNKRYLAMHDDRYPPIEIDESVTVLGKLISAQTYF